MTQGWRMFAAGVVLVFLAGCVPTQTIWTKKNVSEEEMAQDLRACSHLAGMIYEPEGADGKPRAVSSTGSYYVYMGSTFEKCMTERGYRKKQ